MAKIPDLAAIRDWCLSKFQPVGSYASPSDIPTQTSQLTNDSGYVTSEQLDNVLSEYLKTVPVATTTIIGGVKADGTTITIDADGTIHAVSAQELETSILEGES